MKPQLTPWGYYWVFVWFIGGFGIPEAYGLLFNAKDTLSDNWWAFESVDVHHPFDFAEWTPLHYLLGVMMAVGLVWLMGHLIFGIWRTF